MCNCGNSSARRAAAARTPRMMNTRANPTTTTTGRARRGVDVRDWEIINRQDRTREPFTGTLAAALDAAGAIGGGLVEVDA